MAEIGLASLVLTLVVALYGFVAFIRTAQLSGGSSSGWNLWSAWNESGRRALVATTSLVTLSSLCLLYLLLTNDFSVEYVYESTSTVQPLIYHISALWQGQAGSVLFWLWCLAAFSLILVIRPGTLGADAPRAFAVLAALQAGFAVVLTVGANPFVPAETFHTEGFGGNPLLENPGMIYHPPAVLAAYAISSIPFAWLVAGLIGGRVGDVRWLRGIRPWVVLSWLLLTVGILLGAQWAYVELGWGGYWGWDPVENASLIPWLVSTALLHGLLMQERRGMFKTWNAIMVSAVFLLCIFATWITRGGIITSVHAFGQSIVGNLFLLMLVISIAFAAIVIRRGRRQLTSGYEVEDLSSREAMFLYTAFLFCGAAALVLLGTVFPALTEAFGGQKIEWGTEGFAGIARILGPLFVVLLGLCPLMSWRHTDGNRLLRAVAIPLVVCIAVGLVLYALQGQANFATLAFALVALALATIVKEFYSGWRVRLQQGEGALTALVRLIGRNRRRYGGYLVHLGVLLMLVGITGQAIYQQRISISLEPGQSAEVGPFRVTYANFGTEDSAVRKRFYAQLDVYQGDRKIDMLQPERNFHYNVEQWVTEVALRPRLSEDLYVLLLGLESDGLGSFDFVINPLINWLWIGGIVATLAALLAVWPTSRGLQPVPTMAVERGQAS